MAGVPNGAVFLSYASEDAAAAERLCGALRAAGIEVWFDRSELRGGDVWDRQIHEQIHRCRLFMPLISAHTEARDEGYFRREWGIALDRMRDMAEHRAFLVPVAIDGTSERGAAVPERFRQVQWTRLANAEATPAFTERVAALLGQPPRLNTEGPIAAQPGAQVPRARPRRAGWAALAVAAVAVVLAGTWLAVRHAPAGSAPGQAPAAAAQPAGSDNSIAVLPFADMSEKHEEEYFGDGMAEELIDRLGQLSELRVISRTSAFQFKGKSDDARAIGARLGVSNILEGSVRRSGEQLRIDVKLVGTSDGSQRWSQRYDRRLSDVFRVQDEIAADVVLALKAKLIEAGSPEYGHTASGAAHNLLLEGRSFMERWSAGDADRAVSAYREALRIDPSYALAWAELSWAQIWSYPSNYTGCSQDARRAIELSPNLAQAHATRGWCESALGFDWALGEAEFDRALVLEPNNLRAIYGKGRLARILRNTDESLRLYKTVLERDPVNPFVMSGLSGSLLAARRFGEAEDYARRTLELSPNMQLGHWYVAYALLWKQELEAASREISLERVDSARYSCTALIERARRNQPAADAAFRALLNSTDSPKTYYTAQAYAARGDSARAIDWLERTRLARLPWFGEFMTDPAFDAIRDRPEFVAYLRRMKLLQ